MVQILCVEPFRFGVAYGIGNIIEQKVITIETKCPFLYLVNAYNKFIQ